MVLERGFDDVDWSGHGRSVGLAVTHHGVVELAAGEAEWTAQRVRKQPWKTGAARCLVERSPGVALTKTLRSSALRRPRL